MDQDGETQVAEATPPPPEGPGSGDRSGSVTEPDSHGPVARVLRAIGRQRSLTLSLVGLIGLIIVFAFIAPNFLTYQNLVNITRELAVLLIISVGMTFVILQGSIDLSAGPIASIAGLVAALVVSGGGSPVIAIAAGLAASVVIGVVNGWLFAFARIPSFLATLGLGLVVTGVATWIVGGRPVSISPGTFRDLAIGEVIPSIPNVVLIALAAYGVGVAVNFRTKFGRYVFAIGGGEPVAKLSGVPVRRYKFYSLIVSAICAGLGGVLLAARVGAATPTMGDPYMLAPIAAVVMGGTALSGGVGGVHRTFLGVATIIVLRNGLDTMAVGPYVQLLAQGLVVIVAVAVTLDRDKVSIVK